MNSIRDKYYTCWYSSAGIRTATLNNFLDMAGCYLLVLNRGDGGCFVRSGQTYEQMSRFAHLWTVLFWN